MWLIYKDFAPSGAENQSAFSKSEMRTLIAPDHRVIGGLGEFYP